MAGRVRVGLDEKDANKVAMWAGFQGKETGEEEIRYTSLV